MSIFHGEAPARLRRVVGLAAVVLSILLVSYFLLAERRGDAGQSKGDAHASVKPDLNSASGSELRARQAPAIANTARLVAAPAIRPTKANELTFESADDLYVLANAAANSKIPMELYNGWIATRSCTRTPLERVDLEHQIALDGNDSSKLENVRSAKMILQRCRGFFNNDPSANMELEKRLEYKLRADPDFYFEGTASKPPTDEQFAAVLDRGDWYTFSLLMQEMLSRKQLSAVVKRGTPDEIYFAIGWMQAACDLGKDCSSDGLSYANFCLAQNNCLGSWNEFTNAGVSEAQQLTITEYRKQIVLAFLQRDLKFFGIQKQ